MEIFFLNVIAAISDSRYWLGPLLVICVCVILFAELIGIAQEEIEEARHLTPACQGEAKRSLDI